MCGERAQTRRNEQKRDETTFVRCYRRVMIVLAFQLLSEATLKTPQPLARRPPLPYRGPWSCPQGDGWAPVFLAGRNAVGTPTDLHPWPWRLMIRGDISSLFG